jgi:hypothetical protein
MAATVTGPPLRSATRGYLSGAHPPATSVANRFPGVRNTPLAASASLGHSGVFVRRAPTGDVSEPFSRREEYPSRGLRFARPLGGICPARTTGVQKSDVG